MKPWRWLRWLQPGRLNLATMVIKIIQRCRWPATFLSLSTCRLMLCALLLLSVCILQANTSQNRPQWQDRGPPPVDQHMAHTTTDTSCPSCYKVAAAGDVSSESLGQGVSTATAQRLMELPLGASRLGTCLRRFVALPALGGASQWCLLQRN
jgi:hypothetical protein